MRPCRDVPMVRRMKIQGSLLCLAALTLNACDSPPPRAGVINADNQSEILPRGDMAGGRIGDYYLKNDLATFIIQRPTREAAFSPFGGTLIDAALAGGEDRFGELFPALAVSRTVRAEAVALISDGTGDEPAEIEVIGRDAINGYYNLRGLDPGLVEAFSVLPEVDSALGLKIRIRYTLPDDEARLTITYSFINEGQDFVGLPLAFLVDSGGAVESFTEGEGFDSLLTKDLNEETIPELLTLNPSTSQIVSFASDVTMSIVPRRVGDKSPPLVLGASVPQLGGGFAFEAGNILDGVRQPLLHLFEGDTKQVVIDVVLAKTPNEAMARGWELVGKSLAEVSGCVTDSSGAPAPQVRVGFMQGERAEGFFLTGADGCYAGRLPPGAYVAIAGGPHRTPSQEVAVSVPGSADLVLPALGALRLNIATFDALDSTAQSRKACRLTLLGERPAYEHKALGVTADDGTDGITARMKISHACDEVLPLPPGRYLAFVNRGPEFDQIEQVVEVTAGNTTTLTGRLHRVVDSSGYAASDFHVHSVYSTDSVTPPEERVASLAAEGLDFWASTDHDYVADYRPVLRAMSLESDLLTIPGAEVTTFDSGHFGAYPLVPDQSHTNGGSPDWTVRDDGHRPTMQELFDDIHGRGAMVQVNHPRSGGLAVGAYFTRAGLTWDASLSAPAIDLTRQMVANGDLRFEGDDSYYSADFEIIEITNHLSTYVRDGMVFHRSFESTGHDWMNYLSSGELKVGVANSDTHSLNSPPGVPRTWVGGHAGGTEGLLSALRRGDAVMSSGPFVSAYLTSGDDTAGLGEVLSPADDALVLHVRVETPGWFQVNRLEVIANAVFIDMADYQPAEPAVPRVELVPRPVMRPNGGVAHVSEVEIPIDFSASPFTNGDSWLVVRVGGDRTPMFPYTPGGGTLDTSATTAAAFLSGRHGQLPYAVTNPIFIDGDGDGDWR